MREVRPRATLALHQNYDIAQLSYRPTGHDIASHKLTRMVEYMMRR